MCVSLVDINGTSRYQTSKKPRLKPKKVYKEVPRSSSTPNNKTLLFSRFIKSLDNPFKSFKALITILIESISVRQEIIDALPLQQCSKRSYLLCSIQYKFFWKINLTNKAPYSKEFYFHYYSYFVFINLHASLMY